MKAKPAAQMVSYHSTWWVKVGYHSKCNVRIINGGLARPKGSLIQSSQFHSSDHNLKTQNQISILIFHEM